VPSVYQSSEPDEELGAYVSTYLREEIQAESLVRKLPQFFRFLTVAALANGQTLNFEQISNDAQVPASTIREHYQILADTLVGFTLNPWQSSGNRKSVSRAKFYIFDTGVAHTLAQTQGIDRNSDLYGRRDDFAICSSFLKMKSKPLVTVSVLCIGRLFSMNCGMVAFFDALCLRAVQGQRIRLSERRQLAARSIVNRRPDPLGQCPCLPRTFPAPPAWLFRHGSNFMRIAGVSGAEAYAR
jgi:hypothetical protein